MKTQDAISVSAGVELLPACVPETRDITRVKELAASWGVAMAPVEQPLAGPFGEGVRVFLCQVMIAVPAESSIPPLPVRGDESAASRVDGSAIAGLWPARLLEWKAPGPGRSRAQSWWRMLAACFGLGRSGWKARAAAR